MPIIVGTDKDINQYMRSEAKRATWNIIGLGLFTLGLIIVIPFHSFIMPENETVFWIGIIFSIIGFILMFITREKRRDVGIAGMILFIVGLIILVISNSNVIAAFMFVIMGIGVALFIIS